MSKNEKIKIVIAPDSFKECLSSMLVAKAIAKGIQEEQKEAELILAPMADGGEGTLSCILNACQGEIHRCIVHDPLRKPIQAVFGIIKNNQNNQIAIIEMAESSGLSKIPLKERDPLQTTTLGTGELILEALNLGCREFIIGLGGSGTIDGGMGALGALGVQFIDQNGKILDPIGSNLSSVYTINTESLDPRLLNCQFTLAHDVNSPLIGKNGTVLYAAQKGASPFQIQELEKSFEHYAAVLKKHSRNPRYIYSKSNKEMGDIPGTGAAGGLAAGLFAFLNAELVPGASVIIKLIELEDKIKTADLVITGEGQMDSQTLAGKVPFAIATLAKKYQVPVIAIVGKKGEGCEKMLEAGIQKIYSITEIASSEEEAKQNVEFLLTQISGIIAKDYSNSV